ncbi:hypothetical protein RWE15_00630 [Virgibacillus halophilus]|uniref:4'-phosphopantetheinyl transferase N-terminal domain-containing protein n=1 Tax=Tigheibacillus halophilus TaxID=361280 RepID=A0ABU5C1N4_9BACI|nr:hypothetical protein [Virgibacillus halophilus]
MKFIFVNCLKKKSQAELEMLSERVPDERQKRIRQFFHLEDAYRAMIGDLLLNHVLQEKTGTGLKDTVIEKNVYGKPFLYDYPAFQYNISHSGKYVVCALHDQPVGIDVEKVQSFDLRIAKHLFYGV